MLPHPPGVIALFHQWLLSNEWTVAPIQVNIGTLILKPNSKNLLQLVRVDVGSNILSKTLQRLSCLLHRFFTTLHFVTLFFVKYCVLPLNALKMYWKWFLRWARLKFWFQKFNFIWKENILHQTLQQLIKRRIVPQYTQSKTYRLLLMKSIPWAKESQRFVVYQWLVIYLWVRHSYKASRNKGWKRILGKWS